MKVLIQGAGITGLALARELQLRGIEFLLVEHTPEIKPVGAGITLGANALACLAKSISLERLMARGQSLERLLVTDERGEILMTVPSRIEGIAHAAIAIHRHELHQCLLDGIPQGSLLLGTEVESFSHDEQKVHARLSNGLTAEFDYLIGADGLRSSIRKTLFPQTQIRYSGYTCWRSVLDQPLRDDTAAIEMWGPGRRIGLVPISKDRIYVYLTLNTSMHDDESRYTALTVNEVIQRFTGFGGEAPRVLEGIARSGKLIHNDLEEVALSSWSRGRVAVIGDAAHAMTPNLGQGAAMGIEDAAVLAEVWAENPNPSSLLSFEKSRAARVRWIQNKSREMGKMAQAEHPWAIWLRNKALKITPASVVTRNMKQILTGI